MINDKKIVEAREKLLKAFGEFLKAEHANVTSDDFSHDKFYEQVKKRKKWAEAEKEYHDALGEYMQNNRPLTD